MARIFKFISTTIFLFISITLLHAQNHTFIALDNAGKLYEVNTDSCKSTPLTFCNNFKGTALSIAMDGNTIYIVDNQGYLYSNTIGPAGTTTTCKNLGQFKSKSIAIYGMTVGPGPVVYAASGSLIETYTPATTTFGNIGSLPTTWTIGGDLLFYKGQLYEAVNVNGSTTNNALIQVNIGKPSSSTLYMSFNAGTKVFGFASVTVPCANNQAYALSTGTSTTDIYAVDMTNKIQSTTATCVLPYKVNDAASVAETQSATPPVAPTVISPLNFCQNDPVTSLTATVASNIDTLKWYTVYTGGTATGKPIPTLSTATLGTVKYYVSDFDTSTKCESTRDSIVVNINPYPAVPTINPIGPDTICSGSPLLLTSTALATNINQWYLNNTVIGGSTGITYSASAAGNYTIKTSTAAGCSRTSIPSNVAITLATISYPGSPFCPVGTKAVIQTGDTGGRYTVIPVGLIIDSITGLINLGTSKAGTYTVTYTVGPAHCPFTTSVIVQPQSAGISYSKPTYCKSDPNQTVIFAPSSLTTGTFSASPAGLSIAANGTINPSASTVGSYQIKYTYGTAGVGCGIMTTTDSVSITAGPVVPAITGLSQLCTGSSITLSDTLAGGVWSSSNTSLATVISTTGIVTAVAQGNVNINYTITNSCGSAFQSFPLTITNGPVTPPITGTNNVCIAKTITLSNTSAGGTWTSSDNTIATINNSGVVTGVAAGNITITYSVTNTCGVAAQTLPVTVNAPTLSSTPVSICPTALPYSWNGNSYAVAGSYTIHLTNALGCDSAATLVLTLKTPTTSSTPVSICPTALPYSWNGNSYPAAGTYTIHLNNAVGCDSAATLVLSLKTPTTSSTPVSVCPSALPYSWNGNSYASVGSYTVHLTNAAGCDSAATLVLTLNATSSSSTPVSVCPTALPYSWNGNSYPAAGTYTVHLTNILGCDSAATLVLSLNANSSSNTTVSVCPSALPYSWNGNSYPSAGSYTVHLTNVLGCDSAATLLLTLKTTSTSSTPVSICPSALPYSWNGNSYATIGTYIVHLTNALGCDSAATLVLTFKAASTSSTTVSVCPSAFPYSWNGSSYATVGTYTVHLTNALGCDSAASLVLSLLPTSTSSTPVSVCPTALPYSWNGNSYATAGTYTIHLTNALGCDSAATLVLTLKTPSTSSTPVSICPTALPYSWNGNSYPTAGAYTIHLTNAVGCDSAATLVLTLKAPTASSTAVSICQAALPYTWNANSFLIAGTYTLHLTNAAGCDSAATLVLSVNAASASSTPVTICANALPYSWNGNSYAAAGTYTVHLTNAVGCDSAATLLLSLKPLPIVNTITGGNSLCANSSVQLADVTPAGTWFSSNAAAATVSNTGLVQGIAAGNTIISYSLTNSCGTTTQTMNVTVGALPVVNPIVGNNSICVNTNTQLFESTVGGTWTSNNTAVIIVDNTGLATALAGGTAQVTYSVTNLCGTDSQHINIVVGTAPFVNTITGYDSVCVNGTLQLADITPAGIWTSATPSATVNANGLVSGVKAGSTVIYYSVTNICGTSSKQFTVYINDVPTVADINGATNICINTTSLLTDNTIAGTWTSSSTSIAPVSAVGLVTGSSVGTATISYAVTNTCGTTTKTFGVTVLAPPVAFPIKGKDSLCTATTTQLTDAGIGGTWYSLNPTVATIDNNGKLLAVSAGIDTITYSVSNFCGTAIDSFPVLVHPVPSCSFTINPTFANICLGDSITVSDNTSTNPVVMSLWNFGNGVVDSGMFVTYTYPSANSYYVTHRIIDQYGCISNPYKLPVIVQTLPTVNNGYTVYVLQNDSITLNPQVTGLDNHSTVNWSPGIFLNNNTILNPVCTPANDITYTLTVKDSIGCPGKDTLHVVVLEPIQIPNVFSPNGDGPHDYWVIPNLDRFPGINLKVFDRNGQVVYTCRDKYVPWNGKYGGKEVPFGVYYYILDRGFKLPLLSGSITIIR